MVYESDFYTTRRPYRATPSLSTYTVTKREIPWEKVPFVPRPSLIPDPVTAYGRRKPDREVVVERVSIISPNEKAKIKPKADLAPIKPYISARDRTKERVLSMIRREPEPSALPNSDSMDLVLPKLYKISEMSDLPYKRRLAMNRGNY